MLSCKCFKLFFFDLKLLPFPFVVHLFTIHVIAYQNFPKPLSKYSTRLKGTLTGAQSSGINNNRQGIQFQTRKTVGDESEGGREKKGGSIQVLGFKGCWLSHKNPHAVPRHAAALWHGYNHHFQSAADAGDETITRLPDKNKKSHRWPAKQQLKGSSPEKEAAWPSPARYCWIA